MSSKERDSQSENLTKEIATIVAEKCVNPATKLPYPVAIIEKAMKDVHFSPNLAKNAKQQVNDQKRSEPIFLFYLGFGCDQDPGERTRFPY